MNLIVKEKWKITVFAYIAVLLWTFIVCYPNPYIFIRNFIRYIHFPIDISIVDLINTDIPDDPSEIEKFVRKLIVYEYDWVNYGVPWFVPTPKDAVARQKGDCESRAMVFASILSEKDIPYNIKASLVHIWIEYPNKKPTKSENDDIAYISKVNGKYGLKLPDLSQWRKYISTDKEMFWDAMPKYRKIIMVSGWAFIIVFACLLYFYNIHKHRKF